MLEDRDAMNVLIAGLVAAAVAVCTGCLTADWSGDAVRHVRVVQERDCAITIRVGVVVAVGEGLGASHLGVV